MTIEKKTIPPAIALMADSNRGIYIPKYFIESTESSLWHISEDDARVLLAGPEHEHYWDVWHDVLNHAYWEKDDYKWTLHQDGDLWAVCPELMSDEEKRNFGFDEE